MVVKGLRRQANRGNNEQSCHEVTLLIYPCQVVVDVLVVVFLLIHFSKTGKAR